jgi:hypothetical protein
MSIYIDKYEKYKHKYLELKEQIGGDPNYAYIVLISPSDRPLTLKIKPHKLSGETEDKEIILDYESPDNPSIFVIKKKKNKPYDLPGGKLKKGEDPLNTALRIFKEQTDCNDINNYHDKFTELIIKKKYIFYYVLDNKLDINIYNELLLKGNWFQKKKLNLNLGYTVIDNKTIIKAVLKKVGL